MNQTAFFHEARQAFHLALTRKILFTNQNGVPTNADKNSNPSVRIATGILA
jgi:hypothetical protein